MGPLTPIFLRTEAVRKYHQSGCVGDCSYVWTMDENPMSEDGPSLTGLGPGFYEVTISDDNNCYITLSETITEPTPVTISAVGSDFNGFGVECFGDIDGSINVMVWRCISIISISISISMSMSIDMDIYTGGD